MNKIISKDIESIKSERRGEDFKNIKAYDLLLHIFYISHIEVCIFQIINTNAFTLQ